MASVKHCMPLKKYFRTLSKAQKEEFAERCETTVDYMKLIIFGVRSCTAKLAIDIDRESKGAVKCEELCPEADFNYLRNYQPTIQKATS
ncbi:helix-turn-helix domain-containing protein [Acinetobacter junii]|uniref:helix-turn-helix domain-containing protein n=1 Tax=Acinetobacter junii TaxID=40215 RepID=UPI001F1F7D36|nr:helix-turn-helix domain-containing protein [Acinetobacter junii]